MAVTGAVSQMYMEMAGRHRARDESIMIVKAVEVDKRSDLRRDAAIQYSQGNLKFPKVVSLPRAPVKSLRTTFKATRPTTFQS